MKDTKAISLLILTGIIAMSTHQAVAQYRGGMPGSGGMRGGGRDGAVDSARSQRPGIQRENTPHPEVIMHELYEDLKIAPQQEAGWQAYVSKVQAMVSDLAREQKRTQASPQLPMSQQFDRVLDAARNRLTALEDIAVAAKSLYEELTPEQKIIADSRLAAIVSSAAAIRSENLSEQPGRRKTSQ